LILQLANNYETVPQLIAGNILHGPSNYTDNVMTV